MANIRENWRPVVQDRHEAIFSEPYEDLKLSHTCPGPNGKTFPFQKYYTHTPTSHPIPELGSYELLNLSKPCMSYNQRYDPYFDLPASTDWHWYLSQCFKTHKAAKRSVIVFRSWQGYNWHKDDILNLRAMIVELGLNTGGLYDFKILVEVKDGSAFLASEKEAERVIESVPEEFRGLVHLWSEHEMHGYYPGLSSVFGGNAIHGYFQFFQAKTDPSEHIEDCSWHYRSLQLTIHNTTTSTIGRWISDTSAITTNSSARPTNGHATNHSTPPCDEVKNTSSPPSATGPTRLPKTKKPILYNSVPSLIKSARNGTLKTTWSDIPTEPTLLVALSSSLHLDFLVDYC